ncbi:hypothetical protein H0H93_004237, partial [Arthromyces matolae]
NQDVAMTERDPLRFRTRLELSHSDGMGGPRIVGKRHRTCLRLMTYKVEEDTSATYAVICPV